MIPTDTKRRKAYDRLRQLTSGRIARALDLADEGLVNLSLSQLINLLFLMHGDSGSTGNFNVVRGRSQIVGPELIWREPETEKVAVTQLLQ